MKLTLEMSVAREDWRANWESYRRYAVKVAFTYCARRGLGFLDCQEVGEEALSESWRDVCNGTKAETAIRRAVDRLTDSARKLRDQSRELPELPEHSPEYMESETDLAGLIASLPDNLRPLATMLSAGYEPCAEVWEILGISKQSGYKQLARLRRLLGSRFGYLLLSVMDIAPAHRIAG